MQGQDGISRGAGESGRSKPVMAPRGRAELHPLCTPCRSFTLSCRSLPLCPPSSFDPPFSPPPAGLPLSILKVIQASQGNLQLSLIVPNLAAWAGFTENTARGITVRVAQKLPQKHQKHPPETSRERTLLCKFIKESKGVF